MRLVDGDANERSIVVVPALRYRRRDSRFLLGAKVAMNDADIYWRLAKIFGDVFDEEEIEVTPELSAKDIAGWDSLTNIRLMVTVERAFSTKFSAQEIGSLQNVGELVALIKKHI